MSGILEYVTSYEEPLDLNINLLALDEEWVRQPRMYMTASRRAAEASADADRAKSAVSVAKAEVEMECRKQPDLYGLEKATDRSVEAAVAASPEVRAAETRLHKAKHDAAVLWAAVDALEHKKRALESIVTLQGREAYASPRAPRTEKGEEMTRAETREVRSKAIRQRD